MTGVVAVLVITIVVMVEAIRNTVAIVASRLLIEFTSPLAVPNCVHSGPVVFILAKATSARLWVVARIDMHTLQTPICATPI